MSDNDYVLVIDDSATMRAMVSQTLRQGAYIDNIIEAESPDHALRLLGGSPGRIKFIVSDWNMPGMPLPDFMAIIEENPDLALAPLFLITGSEESKVNEIISALHPTALLTKPFQPAKLLELVETHIGISERRCAKRVEPLTRCEVDFGLDRERLPYVGEIVNISESGVLIRAPMAVQSTSYIYDYVSMQLSTETGQGLALRGQIVRLEADRGNKIAGSKAIKVAIQFGAMDSETLAALQEYVLFNEPLKDGAGGH